MRLVADVIVGVAFGSEHVARPELDELVGTGADRLQIARRIARLRAGIVAKMMLWQDLADRADEGVGPERRRVLEDHLDGVVVDLLDDDVLVGSRGVRGGREIRCVGPGKDDVVGGERLAVMPCHALLQLPGHARAVRSKAAVLPGRDLGASSPASPRGDLILGRRFIVLRHCERDEAIQSRPRSDLGLLRCARNDDVEAVRLQGLRCARCRYALGLERR